MDERRFPDLWVDPDDDPRETERPPSNTTGTDAWASWRREVAHAGEVAAGLDPGASVIHDGRPTQVRDIDGRTGQ